MKTKTKAALMSALLLTGLTLPNSRAAADALNASEIFTDRDLLQTADLSTANSITLTDGGTVTVTEAGTWLVQGTAQNATVIVDAGDDDKVQLVLDGVSVSNTDTPCIYVKNADKTFVTTTATENSLSVSGGFTADGSTNTDAVIFSKDDLVLNGTGTLRIESSDNGISCKNDLKITGGSMLIRCNSTAIEAKDSVSVAGGTLQISAGNDGLHADDDEDDGIGSIYIGDGNMSITAGDDAVHATTLVQVDGGTLIIEQCREGFEGTVIRINGGEISINASDDGINAAQKSSAYSALAEFNGGSVAITMAQGDTDAVDSNGDVIVNAGTLNITAQSPFDYDGRAEYNGGTIIVNGQTVNSIINQMMGGMPGGMFGGQRNDRPGGFGGGHGGFRR